VRNIVVGNTLSDDGHANTKFDYMLSNPPFGVEWKKVEKDVRKEHLDKGFDGRFGPGLPRVSDGSMLFLLHLISKMRPAAEGGSRIGIVLNGSPLFTGGAGSGESEIRRYVLENDLVEAIIGLPTDMFYNTGIAPTSGCCPTRSPTSARAGCSSSTPAASGRRCARASAASARRCRTRTSPTSPACSATSSRPSRPSCSTRAGKELAGRSCSSATPEPVAPARQGEARADLRVFKNEEFGYTTITVERRCATAGKVVLGERGKQKGKPQPDSSLRDTENVPLTEDIDAYFQREVLPHAPDAWIDRDKSRSATRSRSTATSTSSSRRAACTRSTRS
jgi:type I restriction enzyme M protein